MFDVVLLMAGSGVRSHLGYNKVFHPINGKPLFSYAFNVFIQIEDCDKIICVVRKEDMSEFASLANNRCIVVEGGTLRQDSVRLGVERATQAVVLIHDAARPNIKKKDVLRVYQATLEHGAAVLGIPANNTIKEIDNLFVKRTLNRAILWEMQTPQGIMKAQYLRCAKSAQQDGYIAYDDVELLEKYAGIKAKVIEGDPSNIKVTNPIDIKMIEVLMKEGR